MKKYLLCLLVLSQIVFAGGNQKPVAAQAAYQGLDVLFLVDQSGSMGGSQFKSTGTSNANDPLGLRFQAVQYAFQALNNYRSLVPSRTAFQMGVINFGDTSEVALPWTSIDPNAQNWVQQQQQIVNQLSQDRFGYRNLGNTNFMAAYREAQTMINQLPPAPNGAKHLRAIIILTDGSPCVPAEFQVKSCNDQRDWLQHMNNVLQFTSASFPTPDYRLYVIALTDRFSFWPRLEPIWTQVVGATGSAQRIQRSEEVGPSFLKILLSLVKAVSGANKSQDLVGVQLAIKGKDAAIDVPPYHKAMRVTLFKTRPESTVTLVDPAGNTLAATSSQVKITGLGSAIEAWTVADPVPGNWKVSVSKDGDLLDAYLDLIRVSWNLDAPSALTTRHATVPLAMRVLNSSDQPLPAYADARFALKVEASVRAPDGAVQQVTLQQSAPGVYTANVVPEQEGAYEIDLVATTQNLDGSTMTVVNQKGANNFNVSGLSLEVKPPASSEVLRTQPFTLSAQVNDGKGNMVGNATVEAVLQGPAGIAKYPLQKQGDNSFSLTIPMDKEGQFKVDIQATVPQPSGDPLTLTQTALPALTVKPVSIARLNVLGLQDNATYYTTDGFPSFAPTDLTAQVAVVDSDNKPLDLALPAGGGVPLRLRVFDAHDQEVPQGGQFTASGKGIYDLTLPRLAAGQYKIVVEPDEATTAKAGTLFAPDAKSRTLNITMATNPAFTTAVAVAGVAAASIVGSSGLLIYRRQRKRQHPATGRIAILREDLSLAVPERDTVWSMALDSKHSNHIVINRLPAALKRLTIECPDANLSKRGQVIITLESKKRTLFKRVMMGRGSERVIDEISDGDTVYYLAKDYEN